MSWEGLPKGETELAGYWWVLAYASQSDWAHSQLLAVRLPWPHRTLAQAIGRLPQAASGACLGHIGRLPQAASGACPGHTRAHHRYVFTLRWLGALPIAMAGRIPRPHRELSRYLCKLRDWAHPSPTLLGFQLHAISGGRTSAAGLCNYAPFTEAGRTPRPSVATWAPSMPTPPRKRLRDLPSWSGPMAIAGILRSL